MAGRDLDDEAGIHVPSLISPFKSKGSNKFFFGIVVAAIVLAILFFCFFLLRTEEELSALYCRATRSGAPLSSSRVSSRDQVAAMERHEPWLDFNGWRLLLRRFSADLIKTFLRNRVQRVVCVTTCGLALLLSSPSTHAYSVQTHEQLIDLTWNASIVPLLLSRYPSLTPLQIEQARAYAYGGCMIQDVGYYPFGDPFVSNLTHYVRSGDFVVNLFRSATNANELAFAVGALSHYIGDWVGHATATNVAVPVEFPKLKRKYGPVVNYAEAEHQHVQTEFAFDIYEIAHDRLAPVQYLRHVGLEVPRKQLSLAFFQTYGLSANFSASKTKRINVGGYRFSVRRFIPRVAYAVTVLHRKHEPVEVNAPDLQRLQAEITTIAAKNDWSAYRKTPGIGTYSLAALLYVLPKLGPLKLVDVKGPTQATEANYVHSVLVSADSLDTVLRRFTPNAQTRQVEAPRGPTAEMLETGTGNPRHPLQNRDLDTGNPVKPAGYPLTDETYADLLHRLTANPHQPVPPGVRDDILAYYSDLSLPFVTKKHPEQWAVVQRDLTTIRTMPTGSEPLTFPTYSDN